MWRDRITTIGYDSSLVLSDFSVGMIEEAKRNVGEHANVLYQCIDIMNIPYNLNTFDIVIANMMLYHLSDLSTALKEVRRDKSSFMLLYTEFSSKIKQIAFLYRATIFPCFFCKIPIIFNHLIVRKIVTSNVSYSYTGL